MTKFSRRAALLWLPAISLALAALTRTARALDYPTRPVRIIVGLAAGGPTDLVARVVAQWLSEHLNNQFVVENRTGAGGTLATELLINAPPDGYTLLFAGPTVTISSLLYKKLSNVLDELTPVGVVMRVPNIMIITPSLPVKTVREFIDYAKANPGKLSMASSGVGASPHLSGEYFKSLTKIDMVHVPYRGSGAAYPDLISGKVDVLFDNLGGPALQMVRSGQLRRSPSPPRGAGLCCPTYRPSRRLCRVMMSTSGTACSRRKTRRPKSSRGSTRAWRTSSPIRRSPHGLRRTAGCRHRCRSKASPNSWSTIRRDGARWWRPPD
jgi:hypothetical protein